MRTRFIRDHRISRAAAASHDVPVLGCAHIVALRIFSNAIATLRGLAYVV